MTVKDPQSRKWIISINNPEQNGLERDVLIAKLEELPFSYSCLCYEIGERKTPHVHIYLYSPAPIRFSRIKGVLPTAHLERARGKHLDNRNYITKSGKWTGTDKAETNLPETFWESGILPEDLPEKEDKKLKLVEMVKAGMSNAEIIEEDSSYVYQIKKIDELRQTLIEEEFRTKDRDVQVTFVTGVTGTGKTRDIHNMYGAENICRITNYRTGGLVYFDSYHNEDVLVFEEFSGQIPITEMLNILDRYPLKLPARYMDRQACYTKVYITSNMSLYDLYPKVQHEQPATWSAFLRRISTVITYDANGNKTEITLYQNTKEKPDD